MYKIRDRHEGMVYNFTSFLTDVNLHLTELSVSPSETRPSFDFVESDVDSLLLNGECAQCMFGTYE